MYMIGFNSPSWHYSPVLYLHNKEDADNYLYGLGEAHVSAYVKCIIFFSENRPCN
jgi:hypothetical protein